MADVTRESSSIKTDKLYRVLEFYSGIGGMYFAAKGCGLKTEVVAALEINTTANVVYKHNFPDVNLLQCNIEGLTTKDLDNLAADIFLMSPPCQPFTRVGLKGASNDPRSKSFLHIMDLILRMSSPPDYLLMENVKGFETSDTREHFVLTLNQAGYYHQEFLVSPNQFGIPNSRLRYYMLAKRKPNQFYFDTQPQILNHIPQRSDGSCIHHKHTPTMSDDKLSHPNNSASITTKDNSRKHVNNQCNQETNETLSTTTSSAGSPTTTPMVDSSSTTTTTRVISSSTTAATNVTLSTTKSSLETYHNCSNSVHEQDKNVQRCDERLTSCTDCNKELRSLSEFLETGNDEYLKPFLLPEKVLSRFALVLDIVTPGSSHSCCFTKAYGHYAEGTGSVLKMADVDDTEHFNKYRSLDSNLSDSQRAEVLADLKLRYFTPREVANIMCFPESFGFPEGTTTKQQYRLLGNSLNVHVVTELLKCLLQNDL